MKSAFATLIAAFVAGVMLTAIPAGATVYEVGPGRTMQAIADVPWPSITAGDTILIYYKTDHYYEKFVISMQGTPSAPITVRGVPGPHGELPIIDGNNATTPKNVHFSNEDRGLLKIGESEVPSSVGPANVVIENLDLRSARQPYRFKDASGKSTSYNSFAAAAYIEAGQNITLRNCIIHDSGNGIESSHGSKNVLIEGCYIYDNGIVGVAGPHNNYTESHGITFQYNRFGPVKNGAPSNNLKDRSSNCIVRYNWIEGGVYRLSLVDSDYADIRSEAGYNDTYMYGNIVLDDLGSTTSVIQMRFGGDMGNPTHYRLNLHSYNNTFVWNKNRSGILTLARMETAAQSCDLKNNVFYAPNGSACTLTMEGNTGKMSVQHNASNAPYTWSKGVTDGGGNIFATGLELANTSLQDYTLVAGSPCINKGIAVSPAPVEEYVKFQSYTNRPQDSIIDIGAFEYASVATNASSSATTNAVKKSSTTNAPPAK